MSILLDDKRIGKFGHVMHIAIAGNIGSGKTTLTKILARHYGYRPIFESTETNPYINSFYEDMRRWSFNIQIYYLHTRTRQLLDIQQRLAKIEQNYRAEAMRIRQELQEDEARMLKSTTTDLRRRIEKFAEKGGYDLILDKNAAPYSRKAFDVTDDLLKDMGVEPANAKGRDEGK